MVIRGRKREREARVCTAASYVEFTRRAEKREKKDAHRNTPALRPCACVCVCVCLRTG